MRRFFYLLAVVFSIVPLSIASAINDCNGNGVEDLQDILVSEISIVEASPQGNFVFRYGDMNRDGCIDLVSFENICAGSCNASTRFTVDLSDCNGNFESSYSSPLATFDLNQSFKLAQTNQFGYVDVLAIPSSPSNEPVTVYKNAGDGRRFTRATANANTPEIEPEARIESELADLDDDGIEESFSFKVVSGNPMLEVKFSNSVTTKLFRLPSQFIFSAEEETMGASISTFAKDINQDSKLDLIVYRRTIDETEFNSIRTLHLAYFLNEGPELLSEATHFGPGEINARSSGLDFTDFNHDGLPEIFARASYTGNNAFFSRGTIYTLLGNATSLDINANQVPDECETQYTLWNSYLRMHNILELINQSDEDERVWVEVRENSGKRFFGRHLTIPARSQRDFILNDLNGFETEKFGVVGVRGKVTGRLQFYRPTEGTEFFTEFDYSFATPLQVASKGVGHVGFNTFEPSNSPQDQSNLVANWLSLVNLAPVDQTFIVERYGVTGDLIDSRTTEALPPYKRIDISAGHDLSGRQVGLLTLKPQVSDAPYLSQVIRYGYSSDLSSFNFAFPLATREAANSTFYSFMTTKGSAANWLELLNTKDEPVDYSFKVYGSDGTQFDSRSSSLAAHAQAHIYLNDLVGADAYGYVEVIPSQTDSMIAQSMVYSRDSAGSILSMHGTPEITASEMRIATSYNAFLRMKNILRISNFANANETLSLGIEGSTISGSETEYTLAPFETLELDLSDFEEFGTSEDSYGALVIDPGESASVGAYVLREHFSTSSSQIDFRSPNIARTK